MLVLTRKVGDLILIGDEIKIRILQINGDHVRLGVEAPRSVQILRGELLAEIHRETASSNIKNPATLAALAKMMAKKPAEAPKATDSAASVPSV